MLEYITKPAEAGSRLDVLVSSLYPQFTRSALGLLFDKKLVSVNGSEAKAAYKVRADDNIMIDETYLSPRPPDINLPVLYEDQNILVIDKPGGLLTHSKGSLNPEPTVASFIKSKIADSTLSGNRAGIVHRLDRGTSGVIITAKNSRSQKWLQKQFSQRKVKKIYRAVVDGVPEPPAAVIDAPIGRNPKKPQTFKVMSAGRPALTQYKVIKDFKNGSKTYTEIELIPKTGRTHQIRVHMAYIGHPITGDTIYGQGSSPILLHAQSLEVTLPGGQRKVFKSALPSRFREFING